MFSNEHICRCDNGKTKCITKLSHDYRAKYCFLQLLCAYTYMVACLFFAVWNFCYGQKYNVHHSGGLYRTIIEIVISPVCVCISQAV